MKYRIIDILVHDTTNVGKFAWAIDDSGQGATTRSLLLRISYTFRDQLKHRVVYAYKSYHRRSRGEDEKTMVQNLLTFTNLQELIKSTTTKRRTLKQT